MTEQEQIAEVGRLHGEGLTAAAIGAQLGLSRHACGRRLSRFKRAQQAANAAEQRAAVARVVEQQQQHQAPDKRTPSSLELARSMACLCANRAAIAVQPTPAQPNGDAKEARAWLRAGAPDMRLAALADDDEPEPEIDWDSCLDEEPQR